MKKFFVDIIIIILIVMLIISILVISFYCLIPDQYEPNYVESMWDKYNRLKSINEPKIVLIGDSNLAFGINSEIIQNEIGIPVVNMGLHGGLGNDVQTRLAMSNVNEDDLYVICYTDYAQTKDISQKDLTLIMLSRHRELWDTLSFRQKVELLPAIPDYMFNSMSFYLSRRGNEPVQDSDLDYAHISFNEYGDNTARVLGNDIFDADKIQSEIGSISDETIENIQYWKTYCEEHGATLVLAGYPIVRTANMPGDSEFVEYGMLLSQETGCINISDFSEYIMDPTYFYDSQFHLTLDGAEHRSKLLASDINKYMGNYSDDI